jgi:hypothetical protein
MNKLKNSLISLTLVFPLVSFAEKPTKEKLFQRCLDVKTNAIGDERIFAKKISIEEHSNGCQIVVSFKNLEDWAAFGEARIKAGKSPEHLAADWGNPLKMKFEFDFKK